MKKKITLMIILISLLALTIFPHPSFATAPAPEGLSVEGGKAPNDIKSLTPTFSATYKSEISTLSAKNIEIIIEEKKKSWKWKIEQKSEVDPNETEEVKLKKPLAPGREYEWKVRFQNNTGWSNWKKSNFSTAKFLNLPSDEAKNFLKAGNLPSNVRAETLKKSMKENSQKTVETINSLNIFTLNDILSELTTSVSSSKTAAEILQEMPKEKSLEIVSSMIQMEKFEELEKIISQDEISKERLQTIYEGLPDQLQKKLEEELPEDAKNRIAALSGGVNSTIAIVLLVIILALTLIRYRAEKMRKNKEEKWNKLVAKFLSSGKNRMAITSNIAPKKAAGQVQKAIERLEVQNRVKLGKEENDIYLIRKS